MKSSRQEQARLLELQGIDIEIARLDYKAKTLPVLEKLEQAERGRDAHIPTVLLELEVVCSVNVTSLESCRQLTRCDCIRPN